VTPDERLVPVDQAGEVKREDDEQDDDREHAQGKPPLVAQVAFVRHCPMTNGTKATKLRRSRAVFPLKFLEVTIPTFPRVGHNDNKPQGKPRRTTAATVVVALFWDADRQNFSSGLELAICRVSWHNIGQ
jgi:hypothetical protein